MIKKFFYEGEQGEVIIFTYDLLDKKVELYMLNTIEEAKEIVDRLNKSVQEIMGEEA